MKTCMSPKERVLAALQHKETDLIPLSLGFGVNEPAKVKLAEYLGMKSVKEVDCYLDGYNDVRWVSPRYIGPADRNIKNPDGTAVDVWGVARKPISYGLGEYDEISYYPLGGIEDIKDLDKNLWPSVDWWDTESLRDIIKSVNSDKEHAIIIGNGNIFESSWYMRGFQQMFIDLIENPELAWEIMNRVTDYFVAFFTKVLESAGDLIDIVFTADDMGGQEGLLMSLPMWEELVKPHHMRLNKLLHEYGVKIMYHSDGSIMKIVPGFMDMGIDILEALQFDAKDMDPAKLKGLYGDTLCFHGGLSVQKTMPFGTPSEVREEVKERIKVLGKNGGYILAPSHAVQAGTPPENIVAFLEAARE
jgi:uroporphyrinogen decarboxylase